MKNLAAIFYVDNRFLESLRPSQLQKSLDILTGLFDWVYLRTNIANTLGMLFQPLWSVRNQSEEAYKRRMTREGRTYQERNGERLWFLDFGT